MNQESIAEAFDSRPNNLNAVRLGLAVAVLFAHSWPLGMGGVAPTLFGVDPGGFAVASFFVLSGYLISGSRLRSTGRSFLIRRAARVLPGYWLALIVTASVLAPVSAWGTGEAFSMLSAGRYLGLNVTTWTWQGGIDRTLTTVPHVGVWNGSLWTIPFELFCYLVIGLWFSLSPAARHPILTPTAFVIVSLVAEAIMQWAPGQATLRSASSLLALALGGATVRVCGKWLPYSVWAAGVALALISLGSWAGQFGPVVALPLTYLIIWLGLKAPRLPLVTSNDVSYGVYIYAFPVQQLLASADVQRWGLTAFVAASIVCVAPLSIASWKLVERPAMRCAAGRVRSSQSRIQSRRPGPGSEVRESTSIDELHVSPPQAVDVRKPARDAGTIARHP